MPQTPLVGTHAYTCVLLSCFPLQLKILYETLYTINLCYCSHGEPAHIILNCNIGLLSLVPRPKEERGYRRNAIIVVNETNSRLRLATSGVKRSFLEHLSRKNRIPVGKLAYIASDHLIKKHNHVLPARESGM